MSNHLVNETSPYLLQHRDNPVDWYPWGEEALNKAREENKPIFLSIGYSACHWCHVMAHESFEDESTARLLNDNFVSIKVDREERPDIDSIYMNAVQAISGSGGWPMSVFLMPDGRPFFGGTYFPNESRYGMPSFQNLLNQIISAYRDRHTDLDRDASNLTKAIDRTVRLNQESGDSLSTDILEASFQEVATHFDKQNGGFSSQPKFPPSMTLEFLLRLHKRYGWAHALEMVCETLDKMARGGIYDQIGGGFHRYSTDAMWLVPHFEKMLYDNALLIRIYAYGYQVTGSESYRKIVEETVEYIRREMTSPEGGFYSSQDADSEGHEGKYFVWAKEDLIRSLVDVQNWDAVLDYWGAELGPNFEGKSILWIPAEVEIVASRHGVSPKELLDRVATARDLLFVAREKRVHPNTDTKIIASWNGLMIASLAVAARVLKRVDIRDLAERAGNFVLDKLLDDNKLYRTFKDSQARFGAFLEDYACVSEGFLELYSTTFDLKWLRAAIDLSDKMVDMFWDEDAGFFDTAKDHEQLISRPQELTDNATPSGTSMAAAVLLRLSILADKPTWREIAEKLIVNLGQAIAGYPTGFSYLACQADFLLSEPHEIALVGDLSKPDMDRLLEVVRGPFRPNQVVAHKATSESLENELISLLRDRVEVSGSATAYVCHHYTCRLPVTSPEALAKQLDETQLG